jgi:hypothetical protein
MREAGLTWDQALMAAEIMEAELATAKPERSGAAVRQQRYRDRKKAEEGITRDVTCATNITRDENRNGVTPVDASRVEYTSLPSEEVINPLTTPSGSIPPKAKSPPLGSRLPDDWQPDIDAAMALGLGREGALQQADRFRDYWRGIPGAKGRKSDWSATWRNWCRRTVENLPSPRPGQAHDRTGHHPRNDREARRGVWAEVLAEERGEGVGGLARTG